MKWGYLVVLSVLFVGGVVAFKLECKCKRENLKRLAKHIAEVTQQEQSTGK